jgi:chromosome segregation ATPase
MSSPHYKLAQITQWVRLREAQLETARLLRDEKRQALDASIEAMNRRRTELDAERQTLKDLKDWTTHPQRESMPRLLDHVHARQADLTDRIERCEYALIDDENHVAAATKDLETAQAQWSKATQRVEIARKLLADARKMVALVADRRFENETDASTSSLRSVMG